MRSTLAIEAGDVESLARVGAEVAVAGFFEDERPLRGGAGIADWRLCGFLSRLLLASRATGESGEAVLATTQGRLRAPRLILLGLGPCGRYGPQTHARAVALAVQRVLELGAGSMALDLPGPDADPSLRGVADGVLAGACAVLDAQPSRLLVRLVAPSGGAARLRAALDASLAARTRGATSVRMMRPPAAPSSSSVATAGPGTSRSPA